MKHSVSMFHFWFQCFIFIYHTFFQKTHLKKNKNPMGAIKNLNGREIKTQWEKRHWNIEIKSETLNTNVSPLETIDYQCIVLWKWNMKQKTSQGKYYVRARKECILTWVQCVLTSGLRVLTSGRRVLTWGRRVPASVLPCWGSRPQHGNALNRKALACQGIEPWQANTDAGTRRPQVRTRRLSGEDASPIKKGMQSPTSKKTSYQE